MPSTVQFVVGSDRFVVAMTAQLVPGKNSKPSWNEPFPSRVCEVMVGALLPGTMTVRVSVVMVIVRVAHVAMTIGDHVVRVAVHLVLALLRSRRQTKSVIGVVVAG